MTSTDECINKLVHPYNETLFGNKKKWAIEPQKEMHKMFSLTRFRVNDGDLSNFRKKSIRLNAKKDVYKQIF